MPRTAALFQRDKSVISRHVKNVFEEGELRRQSVVAEFATTAVDGKTYQVEEAIREVKQLEKKLAPRIKGGGKRS